MKEEEREEGRARPLQGNYGQPAVGEREGWALPVGLLLTLPATPVSGSWHLPSLRAHLRRPSTVDRRPSAAHSYSYSPPSCPDSGGLDCSAVPAGGTVGRWWDEASGTKRSPSTRTSETWAGGVTAGRAGGRAGERAREKANFLISSGAEEEETETAGNREQE